MGQPLLDTLAFFLSMVICTNQLKISFVWLVSQIHHVPSKIIMIYIYIYIYLRAAAPAADPGQKKRFVCLRDDTKTKEFAQVRSSFAVTRRCLLLPFASDIFWCNPQSSQVRWMDACVGDILWSFAWDIAASKMFIHFKHQLSTRGMPGSVFIQCGSQDIRI